MVDIVKVACTYTHIVCKNLLQSKSFYIFRYFLSTNTFYDELLAINIAGQTYLWEVLHHLATQRSLYSQMLDILVKAIQIFGTNDIHPKSCNVYAYICVHIHISAHFPNSYKKIHVVHSRTYIIYEI